MKYLPRKLQVVTEKPSKNFENKGSDQTLKGDVVSLSADSDHKDSD